MHTEYYEEELNYDVSHPTYLTKKTMLTEAIHRYYEESQDYYHSQLSYFDFVYNHYNVIKEGIRWKYYHIFVEELNKMPEDEVEAMFLYCQKSEGDIEPIIYVQLMKWYKKFAKHLLDDNVTKMGMKHKKSFIAFVLMLEITNGNGYTKRVNKLFNL